MNLDVNELERLTNLWDSRKKNPMTEDEVYQKAVDFAKAHDAGVLGTGHGGEVRCTPVDYAFHDDAFYIVSEGGHKFNHLFYNNNVSFAVFYKKEGEKNTFKSGLHSLQVIGKAELLEPFSDEYNHALTNHVIPLTPAGIKNLPYPMYVIKITPQKMILLDSDLNPGRDPQGLDPRQVWERKEKL